MVQKEAISGLDTLVRVASRGLTAMYDPQARIFCQRAVQHGAEIKYEGRSQWETLVALLGLNEAHQYDIKIPFDVVTETFHHIRHGKEGRPIDELGVFLWLTARAAPEELAFHYASLDLPGALDRSSAAKKGITKDLSCLLIGLSEIRLSDAEEPPLLDDLAYMVRQLLFVNYGGFGVFRSMNKRGLLSKKRGGYGTFIDQALAIYAFTRYARAFNDPHSLEIALFSAQQMIVNQGEHGEWWSLYDVENGRVERTYPVYAMHQSALGPLALFSVSELTGEPFAEEVNDGILWLFNRNELDVHFVQPSLHVIWEGMYDPGCKLYSREAMTGKRKAAAKDKKRVLDVAYECRPSHLGWLLFALSGYLE